MVQYSESSDIGSAIKEFSRKEKILLVESLLYDVRLDWSVKETVNARLLVAAIACNQLEDDYELGQEFSILREDIVQLLATGKPVDGRLFRERFPDGYIGMDKLHGFKRPYDLSECCEAFVKLVDICITCKNWIFKEGKKC